MQASSDVRYDTIKELVNRRHSDISVALANVKGTLKAESEKLSDGIVSQYAELKYVDKDPEFVSIATNIDRCSDLKLLNDEAELKREKANQIMRQIDELRREFLYWKEYESLFTMRINRLTSDKMVMQELLVTLSKIQQDELADFLGMAMDA